MDEASSARHRHSSAWEFRTQSISAPFKITECRHGGPAGAISYITATVQVTGIPAGAEKKSRFVGNFRQDVVQV